MFGNVDNQTAYSLLGRLRSALCSSEKDLPLVDAMPALAKELQRRQATLQQAANIPNATAMSIIDAVLTEATSMTADALAHSHSWFERFLRFLRKETTKLNVCHIMRERQTEHMRHTCRCHLAYHPGM